MLLPEKALTDVGLEYSGVKKLVEKQNFDTFDLSFYSGSSRETMEAVLRICRAYTDSFDGKMHNLLLSVKRDLVRRIFRRR